MNNFKLNLGKTKQEIISDILKAFRCTLTDAIKVERSVTINRFTVSDSILVEVASGVEVSIEEHKNILDLFTSSLKDQGIVVYLRVSGERPFNYTELLEKQMSKEKKNDSLAYNLTTLKKIINKHDSRLLSLLLDTLSFESFENSPISALTKIMTEVVSNIGRDEKLHFVVRPELKLIEVTIANGKELSPSSYSLTFVRILEEFAKELGYSLIDPFKVTTTPEKENTLDSNLNLLKKVILDRDHTLDSAIFSKLNIKKFESAPLSSLTGSMCRVIEELGKYESLEFIINPSRKDIRISYRVKTEVGPSNTGLSLVAILRAFAKEKGYRTVLTFKYLEKSLEKETTNQTEGVSMLNNPSTENLTDLLTIAGINKTPSKNFIINKLDFDLFKEKPVYAVTKLICEYFKSLQINLYVEFALKEKEGNKTLTLLNADLFNPRGDKEADTVLLTLKEFAEAMGYTFDFESSKSEEIGDTSDPFKTINGIVKEYLSQRKPKDKGTDVKVGLVGLKEDIKKALEGTPPTSAEDSWDTAFGKETSSNYEELKEQLDIYISSLDVILDAIIIEGCDMEEIKTETKSRLVKRWMEDNNYNVEILDILEELSNTPK